MGAIKKNNIVKRRKLTKQDWLKEGMRALGEKGIESIRVENLCERQNVTRGSFYWHFQDREDFLNGVLSHWMEHEIYGIIHRVEKLGGNTYQKMENLFAEANSGKVDFSAELAIRLWARSDKEVARLVEKVDEDRFIYLVDRFLEMELSKSAAVQRSFSIYSLIFGEAMIRRREGPANRQKRQWACFRQAFDGIDIAHLIEEF